MKLFKYLICWIKARYVRLSFADFCALCDAYEINQRSIAKYALEVYLSHYVPEKRELDRIYAGIDSLKWLYLKSIKRDRRLTDYEQHLMGTSMPTGGSFAFPSALREPALKELFDQRNVYKIGEYVRHFAVPANYELLLIKMSQEEEKPNCLSSYRRALEHYMKFAKGEKLTSSAVQLAVLALNDDKLSIAMIENCTMSKNILSMPALRILAERGSLKVLQKLLFCSFIESDELADKILKRFPQLKRIYEMSYLRRPLYKLEQESGQFFGTVAPNFDEYQFIIHIIKTDINHVKSAAFIRESLSMMARPDATPYFCAWCADNCLKVSEQAYQRVRQIAQFYHNRYKK